MANNIQCPACHHPNDPSALVCEVCGTPVIQAGMTVTLLPQIDIDSPNHIAANEALTVAPNASFSDNSNSTDDAMADFRIIDVLGQGGMGAVYRAVDINLERFVALKLFNASHAANSSANTGEHQSLLDEAKLACKLNHPNIVTIYSVGKGKETGNGKESGSEKAQQQNNFIVMELVNGKSLNKLIPENGLTEIKALEYASQIADGLSSAHRENIIHRDIKPHNLMVNKEDNIKILDFGIARLQQKHIYNSTLGHKAEGKSTKVTNLIGTPQYMSPEQILTGEIDARSDIFSFGVVLYEMLAGHRPFKGDSLDELQHNIVNGNYQPIDQINGDISKDTVKLLNRMLDVSPARRWHDAGELSSQIEAIHTRLTTPKNWWQRQHWLSKAAILMPFIALIGWSSHSVIFPPTTQELVQRQMAEAKKIAMLPFENISGDPLLQIFIDGLSISLNSDLTTAGYEQGDGTSWIIPSSEIRKIEDVSAQKVFEKFGVDLVISGSIQHYGSTRQVVLKLINAEDGRQLGTREVTIDAEKLFEGEHAVRQELLDLMSWQVSDDTLAQFVARQPKFDGAYKHYIEGRGYLYRFDQEGNLDRALRSFDAAIEIDSEYTEALVRLAETQIRYYRSSDNPDWLAKGEDTIFRLWEITPNEAGLKYLQAELFMLRGNYQKAIDGYQASVDKGFRVVESLTGQSKAYNGLLDLENAEKALIRGRAISPNNWRLLASTGVFYFRNGMYEKALEAFESLTKMSPNNEYGFHNIAAIYYTIGELPKAIEFTQKAIKLRPTASAYSNLGTMYFALTRYKDSKESYKKAIELNENNYIIWGNLGDALKLIEEENPTVAYGRAYELVLSTLENNPNDSSAISFAAYFCANLQLKSQSMNFASKIDKNHSGMENFYVAKAYDIFDMSDKSIEHLKIAIDRKYPIEEIKESPLLVNVRDSKKFGALFPGK